MAKPKAGIQWRVAPDNIAIELENWRQRKKKELEARARDLAQDMASSAYINAPWTDRTGNARAGLQGIIDVDTAHKTVTLFLTHGVEYGKWLELAHGGRFAIIMPTVETFLPKIKKLMEDTIQ